MNVVCTRRQNPGSACSRRGSRGTSQCMESAAGTRMRSSLRSTGAEPIHPTRVVSSPWPRSLPGPAGVRPLSFPARDRRSRIAASQPLLQRTELLGDRAFSDVQLGGCGPPRSEAGQRLETGEHPKWWPAILNDILASRMWFAPEFLAAFRGQKSRSRCRRIASMSGPGQRGGTACGMTSTSKTSW